MKGRLGGHQGLSWLRQLHQKHRRLVAASFSSARPDLGRLIQNVTADQLEDPALEQYMRANFPEAFIEAKPEAGLDISSADKHVISSEDETEFLPRVRAQENYPRNIRPLQSYVRDATQEEGTRGSKRLRWQGMIPGLLYGSDPTLHIFSHQVNSKTFVKTPWPSLERELDRYHRNFESRVYELTVLPDENSNTEKGTTTTQLVVPHNVQRHPVHSTIYCANFCRYHAGRPLKLPIGLVNEEESPALKRDGFIVHTQRKIECFVADGVDIPERLELECTNLQFRDVIRLDRILLPDGVRFSDRVLRRGDDFIVGVAFGKGRGTAAEEAEEAA